MAKVARAAKLALGNFCVPTLRQLADACVADAKDPKVATTLAAVALASVVRAAAARLDDGPVKTRDHDVLRARLTPLLTDLGRSGIQLSDRFNHQVDDHLRQLLDLIA